jgi:hypothetical protein
MDAIKITGTAKAPTVNFDPENGKLELTGRSIPEDSMKFYKPLLEWLDNYIANPPEKTSVNINLEYFNTSSSKCILDLFKKLEKIKTAGKEIIINWYYEEDNEVLKESGEDYMGIISIPFNFILIKEQ